MNIIPKFRIQKSEIMKQETILQLFSQSFNYVILYQWFHKKHFKQISKTAKISFLNFCNCISIEKSRAIKQQKQDKFIKQVKQHILKRADSIQQLKKLVPYNSLLTLSNLLQDRYNYLRFLKQCFCNQKMKSQKDTLALALQELVRFKQIVQSIKQAFEGRKNDQNNCKIGFKYSNSGFTINKKVFTAPNKKKIPKQKISYRNSLPYSFKGNKYSVLSIYQSEENDLNKQYDNSKSRMKTQATQNHKHNDTFLKSRPVTSVKRKLFSFTLCQQQCKKKVQNIKRTVKRIKTAVIKNKNVNQFKLKKKYTEFGVQQQQQEFTSQGNIRKQIKKPSFFMQEIIQANRKKQHRNSMNLKQNFKSQEYENAFINQAQIQFAKEQGKINDSDEICSDFDSQKQGNFRINQKNTRKFSKRYSAAKFSSNTGKQIKCSNQQQEDQQKEQKQKKFFRQGIKNIRRKAGIINMRESFKQNIEEKKSVKFMKKRSIIGNKVQNALSQNSSLNNSNRNSGLKDRLNQKQYTKYKMAKRRLGEIQEISDNQADNTLANKVVTQQKISQQNQTTAKLNGNLVNLSEVFYLHSKFKEVKFQNFSLGQQAAFFIPQTIANQKQEQLNNIIHDVTQIYRNSNKNKLFGQIQRTDKHDKLFALVSKVRQHYNGLEQIGENGKVTQDFQLLIRSIDDQIF